MTGSAKSGAPAADLSNRCYTAGREHMRGAPEPDFAIVRRLQAENALVPERVVDEPDVFDLETKLPGLPFRRPGQMGLVELLPQFRDFGDIGIREKSSEQHRSLVSASSFNIASTI